ncbi:MAG: hypothetical protein IJB90_03485 [Clostridia bacterium]|nr:hypothetical protein [Clostridia bacterium]
MKKIIIGFIIILLLVLGYFMCFKSINLGSIKIESIKNIKDMSNNLDSKLQQAYELSDQTYPKELNALEESIKKLETSKNKYNTKVAYATSIEDTFGTYLRNYKIETLMVDLGRHSRQNGLKDLRLDLKTTKSAEVYDLDLTIVGTYESVYNFIYSIENDDDLLFEIVNLNVEPYMVRTTTTVTGEGASTSTYEPYSSKETITSTPVITSSSSNSTTNKEQTNITNNNTNDNNAITNNNNNTDKKETSTTKTDVAYDPKNVQAQFTVENITISFD